MTLLFHYKQGAELGSAACQHSLGCYYMRGNHLKKDSRKAIELFKKICRKGYGLAMRDLAMSYQFGNGCMGNIKTAALDDPELDRRVEVLRTLAATDPHWGEDFPGEDS